MEDLLRCVARCQGNRGRSRGCMGIRLANIVDCLETQNKFELTLRIEGEPKVFQGKGANTSPV